MRMAFYPTLVLGLILVAPALHGQSTEAQATRQAASLRRRIESAPRLRLQAAPLNVVLPAGKHLGMVSWMAPDPKSGDLWLIQRGSDVDPVLEVDPDGHILRSFGKGYFEVPHAIRLDPEGNVWTVDAGNSHVIEWGGDGKPRLQVVLSMRPGTSPHGFDGATDVAFGADGTFYVSDGYSNARVVEFSKTGKQVREWGSSGSGTGQFKLPHSLVVDGRGVVYVADRENGRIEEFDSKGRYLGQIGGLGRTYAVALGPGGALWASMQAMNQPTGSPGWLVKFDRLSGRILGWVAVPDKGGLHGIAVDAGGQPMTDLGDHVLRFLMPGVAQPAR